MNLCWTITDDGAFICGDFDSRVTSYSYPTSPNAEKAKRLARRGIPAVKKFAVRVIDTATRSRVGCEREAEYDARNWRRINAGAHE
ncbi:hypothetical protein CCR94_18260 [Rhodoblastus sphagnicola]|uniref:Uncharacterized protein n=1 Tax=Rhodoblastus sphagnicola TaxID=333368 RepID=A0A2S6N0T7_9HYPH|nr:hypothetical protein [Rhodoblastus sphagnicola]MBB4200600.1 hypothetical protein [Rhodoblastus sphagnicola]PPQ28243.1 hypothetical protein CCR94_18260 [Rhodoblastus sphagnicola]